MTYLGIQIGLTLGSGGSSEGDLTGSVFVRCRAILMSFIAASTSPPPTTLTCCWSSPTLCLLCGAGGGGVPRGSRPSNCNSLVVSYEFSFFVINNSGDAVQQNYVLWLLIKSSKSADENITNHFEV